MNKEETSRLFKQIDDIKDLLSRIVAILEKAQPSLPKDAWDLDKNWKGSEENEKDNVDSYRKHGEVF